MTKRTVIVGGVAGGMTTAAKLKRMKPEAEVVVYERSHYISYSACGMPYLLEGKVKTTAQLIARTPKAMRDAGVDVRVRHEVTEVDPEARRVTVKNSATGETFQDCYDDLVLATGARAVLPDLPGNHLQGVFTLRRLEDIGSIRNRLDEGAKRAVVVGGGYIGLEMAEAFRVAGLEVTVVEQADRLLLTVDEGISELVRDELESNDVAVRLGEEVTGFSGGGRLEHVELAGERLAADLALVAVGATPNNELARALGLELGPKGSVLVDKQLRTSRPNIYAVGDVTSVRHLVSAQRAWIPLGDTANQQGRVLARVLAGETASFPGVLGTTIVKVFGRGFAKTGLNRQEAEAAGLSVDSKQISDEDRAGYYPEVKSVAVNLLWERDTERLLGAQIAAYGDAAKRIDVFAALLQGRATLEDVSLLDLAYAPPFSPSLDPVIVAANAARGSS